MAANRRLVERDRLARVTPSSSPARAGTSGRPATTWSRVRSTDRPASTRPRPRARRKAAATGHHLRCTNAITSNAPASTSSAARVNVKSRPTAAIAASGQSSRGRTAQKQSATTSMYAVPSGVRNVDTARRSRSLSPDVEDEVLRQAPRAVMVEPELLVEVGGNTRLFPAVDRNGVHLHDPEHGDAGGGDEHEPPQRRQLDRAPEEVRGDAREVVPQRIGGSSSCRLRRRARSAAAQRRGERRPRRRAPARRQAPAGTGGGVRRSRRAPPGQAPRRAAPPSTRRSGRAACPRCRARRARP